MTLVSSAHQRLNLFRRAWAASGIALLAATWKLWSPQTALPQVPAITQLGALPEVADWVLFGGMVLALVVVLVSPSKSTLWQQGLVAFAIAAVLSMAIDQHRFQPWAYQFVVIAIVLATAKPAAAFKLLRWLTIGIYVWSAWSKCDVTFTRTLGQQFLNSLFGWANFESWSELLRLSLASLFPVAELVVAIWLCFPRHWSKAVWATVALHILLLVVLGPLGLHHKPGVLIWNVYFIVQNLLIFRAFAPAVMQEDSFPQDDPISPAALYVVAGALVWPLVETWSYCDHWPAWSVYSPRVERTSFFVHRSEKDRLTPRFQPFLEPASDDENWFLVRFDRWSLETLDVPLYPQNRFQIAAAAGLCRQFGLTQVRVVRYNAADRWTGKRESKTFTGLGEIEAATKDYVLGANSVRQLVH